MFKICQDAMPDVTLLGVTVLTSTNQEGLEATGVKGPVDEQLFASQVLQLIRELAV